MTTLIAKRTLSFSAAAVLALAPIASGIATESTVPVAQAQSVSTIDNNQALSLTIHKRIGAEGEQGNGTVIQEPNGKPGANIKYKVELVQPLNTADDWKKAAGIKDAATATAWTGDGRYSEEKTTTQDGDANFTGLKKGLYKVTETEVPANSGLVPGAPFLVYVPMTNPDNKSWIYDVHAYPKNSEVAIEKQVEDQDAQIGQEYKYTISSGIPTGKSITKYVVRDTLDKALDATNAKIAVSLGANKESAASLVQGTDYEVKKAGQQIEVEFTETGRGKLVGKSDQKVFTSITTKTTQFVEHVLNDATLIVNNGSSESDTEKKSEDVHTYWGQVEIQKKDGDSKQGLQGAQFQVVKCQQGNGGWEQVGSDALTIDGKQTFETNGQGLVSIKGIHVTDFADNTVKASNYCLKETKAPEGYVANDQLVHFELQKDQYKAEQPGSIKYTAEVLNYTDSNRLPNTGGAGFIGLVLAGLAIIGGGAFWAVRNSRRSN
ncbi:SpaH/EbpB family LPXTG-anchored major pilin [Corynebacterium sp. HMSC28B08]|uniref:SpaH/EbpB family LPXTG-anchored major pilin n=1 Tax=Corynebacterium sp. HMSC28B08 TaxID=1581066 RepID=UPI0008A33948|nr:SpaH/EbpB family LPXTG-anchored major pilin [Corynebacterium sp. HMSC28B08]OFT91638.1 cell surface protein [Corynebacterium sp. HMSC28B08]